MIYVSKYNNLQKLFGTIKLPNIRQIIFIKIQVKITNFTDYSKKATTPSSFWQNNIR
jgi:hypothetical protein